MTNIASGKISVDEARKQGGKKKRRGTLHELGEKFPFISRARVIDYRARERRITDVIQRDSRSERSITIRSTKYRLAESQCVPFP